MAKKVLIVEDNELNLRLFRDLLEAHGAEVRTVRDARDGTPTALTMAEPGQPYTAEGYSLTGTATDANVTITRPGKGSQSCHV